MLVRVRAAGVNKVNWYTTKGYLKGMLTAPIAQREASREVNPRNSQHMSLEDLEMVTQEESANSVDPSRSAVPMLSAAQLTAWTERNVA